MNFAAFRRLALALFALSPAACHAQTDASAELTPAEAETAEAAATRAPTLAVLVTVDWEGRDLREDNLRAMEGLRARHPDVPLVQFLNAAYFTKLGADASAITRSMQRVVAPGDERGLHVHAWKRLMEAAGVPFQYGPTFWGTTLSARECMSDCGHEVPISAYSQAELESVFTYSVGVLSTNGFGPAGSFRAGGWMASGDVQAALAATGFVYDHSAVPSPFLAGELQGLPLLASVNALWPRTTASSQPYRLSTAAGPLVEVPDNGALADYVTADEMVDVFDRAAASAARAPGSPRFVSIGFHQETAAQYVGRVADALDTFKARAGMGAARVRFVTTPAVGR